jgi:hypothetical protein
MKNSILSNIMPCSPLKGIVACFMMGSCLVDCRTLKMEATYSSETSVNFQRTTRSFIPEDRTLHNRLCEKLKSYIFRIVVPGSLLFLVRGFLIRFCSNMRKIPSKKMHNGLETIEFCHIVLCSSGLLSASMFSKFFWTIPEDTRFLNIVLWVRYSFHAILTDSAQSTVVKALFNYSKFRWARLVFCQTLLSKGKQK